MDTETLLKWQEIIAEQAESGESINAFCRHNKISPSTFFKYRNRLERLSKMGELTEQAVQTEKTSEQVEEIPEEIPEENEPEEDRSVEEGTHIVCFIDTENVGKEWPSFILNNSGISSFLLFYTSASTGISVPDFMTLLRSDIDIEAVSCYTGRNALDFQLVTLLGSYAALHPDWMFCILSNDTGYDSVVKFWNDRKVAVSRCRVRDRINVKPQKAEKQSQNKPQEKQSASESTEKTEQISSIQTSEILEILLKHGCESDDDLNGVANIISDYVSVEKENRLQLIYKKFTSVFGQQNGVKLYGKFKKPIYAVLTSLDEKRKNQIQTTGEEK